MFDAINEKPLAFPQQISAECMRWSPVVDLIAIIPKDELSVWIYRLNGQRVWMHAFKTQVKGVQWKPDGKLLTVVMKNGNWCSLTSINGKVIEEDDSADASFRCWCAKGIEDSQNNVLNIDISKSLPKLPSLPSNFNAFGTVSLDDDPESTGLITTGTSKGGLDVSIFGVFSVGKVEEGPEGEIVAIKVNKDLSEHVCVAVLNEKRFLKLWNVDFIRKYGQYLPEVSLIPSRINALINYISDAMKSIDTERKTVLNETSKAMSRIGGDELSSQIDLFDTLITGITKPNVATWLRDLGERGLKKWFKGGVQNYENCIKYMFENCIPGLERLILFVSKLWGLAMWKERGEALGLDATRLQEMLTNCETLLKRILKLIKDANEELSLFRGFGSWIEITFEDLPNSNYVAGVLSNGEEVKTTDVGKFVTKYLTKSVFKQFDENTILLESIKKECNDVFEVVKSAMRVQVKPRQCIELGDNKEVKIRYASNQDYYYILSHDPESTSLQVLRFQPGEVSMAEIAKVNTEDKIVQVEFIDDENYLLLMKCREDFKKMRLVSSSYSSLLFKLVSVSEPHDALTTVASETLLQIDKIREIGHPVKAFSINGERKVGILVQGDEVRYEFISLDEEDEDDDSDEIMESAIEY